MCYFRFLRLEPNESSESNQTNRFKNSQILIFKYVNSYKIANLFLRILLIESKNYRIERMNESNRINNYESNNFKPNVLNRRCLLLSAGSKCGASQFLCCHRLQSQLGQNHTDGWRWLNAHSKRFHRVIFGCKAIGKLLLGYYVTKHPFLIT